MLLDPRAIDLASWRTGLAGHIVATDLDAFADHIQADHIPHAVIVDCTASQAASNTGANQRGSHTASSRSARRIVGAARRVCRFA